MNPERMKFQFTFMGKRRKRVLPYGSPARGSRAARSGWRKSTTAELNKTRIPTQEYRHYRVESVKALTVNIAYKPAGRGYHYLARRELKTVGCEKAEATVTASKLPSDTPTKSCWARDQDQLLANAAAKRTAV